MTVILIVDAKFLPRGSHEQGSGSIFLSNLLCNSDESSLLDCVTTRNQPPGTFSCQYSQDVAIECTGIYIVSYTITYTVPSSQTLMSVLRKTEDATRPVPTLSGATSVVARVAIYSTRMEEAATVSTYHPDDTMIVKFKLSISDVNECSFMNGYCEHLCTDITGGHICSCFNGFLVTNRHNCTGELFFHGWNEC